MQDEIAAQAATRPNPAIGRAWAISL